jgi:hypothetical protein
VRAREAELRRLVDEANARLRAQAESATAPPVANPASDPPRVAEPGDEERERHHEGRHEGKLARSAHEEDDDG